MNKNKLYMLEDGNTTTVSEVMELTGLTRKGTYKRLKRSKTLEEVMEAIPGRRKAPSHRRNRFEKMYGDMPEGLFKLMFGKWA